MNRKTVAGVFSIVFLLFTLGWIEVFEKQMFPLQGFSSGNPVDVKTITQAACIVIVVALFAWMTSQKTNQPVYYRPERMGFAAGLCILSTFGIVLLYAGLQMQPLWKAQQYKCIGAYAIIAVTFLLLVKLLFTQDKPKGSTPGGNDSQKQGPAVFVVDARNGQGQRQGNNGAARADKGGYHDVSRAQEQRRQFERGGRGQ